MTDGESKQEQGGSPGPAKSRPVGWLLAIVGIAVLSSAGGAFAGPLLMQRSAAAAPAPPPEKQEPSDSFVVAKLEPLIVDVHSQDGLQHHLKVGVSVELDETLSGDEFDKFRPRARESVITYLRGLSYESVTNAQQFEKIRAEISKRVTGAIGNKRVLRALITDFVVQ